MSQTVMVLDSFLYLSKPHYQTVTTGLPILMANPSVSVVCLAARWQHCQTFSDISFTSNSQDHKDGVR